MSQDRYLDKDNWKDISKNDIFNAAMIYPSDTERPLLFFLPDENDEERGRLSRDRGDFSAQIVNGSRKAREQKIVMTVKPRRVIVITSDEINQSQDFEYILVAPINTIKSFEKTKSWYKNLTEDKHPIFVYCPNENFERYIDVSQITTIHKSLLIKKVEKLAPDREELLEDSILQCLSLGILDEEEINPRYNETGSESKKE